MIGKSRPLKVEKETIVAQLCFTFRHRRQFLLLSSFKQGLGLLV